MISQKCPKCLSNRVRRGYRPTPIWLKILFRYNLLCDNCNWEFVGFAVPGTVSSKPTKKAKKTSTVKKNEVSSDDASVNLPSDLQTDGAKNLDSSDNPAVEKPKANKKGHS